MSIKRYINHNLAKLIKHYFSTENKVRRNLSEKEQARYFVDFRRVHIFGGKGGNGCLSFLSLYANEWAGPDGGDGGNGGHAIFQADGNTKSLAHLKSIIRAENGGKGQSKHCLGHNAKSTVIKVPIGTYFRNEEGEILARLDQEDATFLAARGGCGGKGNYYFLSNENRAPTTYEEGGLGDEKILYVEMRVMAHFGLVGFPNAGKSLLLRNLTNAKPKVAPYPFTTLRPHVGIIHHDDFQQIAVADIPGMMDGAHVNIGLGCNFLRHITRCTCILFVLDLSSSNPTPIQQLTKLKYELDHYDDNLLKKPHLIIANKIDLDSSQRALPIFLDALRIHYDVVEVQEAGQEKTMVDQKRDFPWQCTNQKQIEILDPTLRIAKIIVVSARQQTNIDLLKSVIQKTFNKYVKEINQ